MIDIENIETFIPLYLNDITIKSIIHDIGTLDTFYIFVPYKNVINFNQPIVYGLIKKYIRLHKNRFKCLYKHHIYNEDELVMVNSVYKHQLRGRKLNKLLNSTE